MFHDNKAMGTTKLLIIHNIYIYIFIYLFIYAQVKAILAAQPAMAKVVVQ